MTGWKSRRYEWNRRLSGPTDRTYRSPGARSPPWSSGGLTVMRTPFVLIACLAVCLGTAAAQVGIAAVPGAQTGIGFSRCAVVASFSTHAGSAAVVAERIGRD